MLTIFLHYRQPMKTLLKNNRGFTLIELIIVISVIGILATIVSLSYVSTQNRARDTQRRTSATIISSSLEKYFDENGEYPSTLKIATANSSAVKQLLHLIDLGSLTTPSTTPGNTTNLWQTGAASAVNKLTYSGNTDVSNSCRTGVAATDSCIDYKIQYYNDETNTVTTILSQHTAGTFAGPPLNSPAAPTLVAALNGANVVATASAVTCEAGATAQYAFQSRTNDGAWSTFSSWAASTTSSTPAVAGMKFGFQVKAECATANSTSLDSPISSEATYIHPIPAPTAPIPYTTSSFLPAHNSGICMDANGGSSVNGTVIQIWACNGGAAQDWAYNSNDKTLRPTYNLNLCITYQGKGVQLVLWTCDGSTARQWTRGDDGSFRSVASNYCIDDSNWGTANGSVIASWDCNGATAQTWNPADSQTAWAWAATTCPAGTTAAYQINNQTTAQADSGWISAGSTPRIVRTTVNQGYTYTTQVQANCANAYTTSPWSSTGSATIAKAIIPPAAPSAWSFWVNGANRNNMSWGWNFTFACGAGTNRYFIEDEWIDNPGNPVYWVSPRQPNGVGRVGWWTADSTGGNQPYYTTWGPNAAMTTSSTYVGGTPAQVGLAVSGRAQGWCLNPVTGRGSTFGPWGQGWGNL